MTDADVSTSSEPTAKPATPAAVEVEIQRRFNEFERRFNERQQKLLEDRATYIDRWLFVVAIVLTFFSIAIPIAAFLASVFGFKKFEEFKTQAQRYLEEIERNRDKSDEIIQGMNAETAADDPTKAKQVVEDIRENPRASSTDKAIAEAVFLQDQGKREEAIKIWHGIADAFEEVDRELAARAHFSVGYLLSQEKPEDKIAAYDQAIRLRPDYAKAYNNRGVAKGELGRYEDAIADYNQAIRWQSNHVNAYFNRGNAQRKLDRHEAAIADYDEAIRLKPNDAEIYNNRGIAKGELGRYEDAIADFNQAIRWQSNHVNAYFNRGNAQIKLGRYEDTIADYNQAIHRKPDYAEAYNNRGIAKGELGRYEDAIADYNQAIHWQSNYADAYFNRGRAQSELGRHEAAIADYDEAVRLKPNDAETYNNRGIAKAALDLIDEARQDFKKARDLARKAGDASLVASIEQRLQDLDNRGGE